MLSTLRFRGVSTDPQVRRLMEHYSDIQALRGTTIPHEDIESVIGERQESNRYRTITNRWRKQVERQTGVVISGRGEAQGVGFRVLTDSEQLGFGVGQRVSAGRRIRRWHTSVSNTDAANLLPAEKVARDFEIAAAAKLYVVMAEVRRELPAKTAPPEQQARPQPLAAD